MNNVFRLRFLCSLALSFVMLTSCYAQKDSLNISKTNEKSFLKKTILPTALIVSGALITEKVFELKVQKDIREGIGKNVTTNADDYLRYAPMAQLAIANVIGLESRNHWFDQTKNLVIIDAASFLIVRSLKHMIKRPRPSNMYIYNSFPSGHTTLAFSNASLLYYEYKDHHPIFAYSGYVFATATGTLRVLNDRHWLGDVLAGAGIGMLITHVVYQLEPLKNWNPFLEKKQLRITPMINSEAFQLNVQWRF